ncbi:MAG: S-layer family protein [Cyanobacteria bacterium P01_F01_bin.150]
MTSDCSRCCYGARVKTISPMLCLLKAASHLAVGLLLSVSLPNQASAQVTADGTLSTTVTSADNLNFVIEAGAQSGSNLFHSFDEFSIPLEGSGVFNNALDIANIFSRVTGGNASDIQGNIRANGTANLFLINPSGIVFGKDASLDIGGSFFATTAENIVFGDGLEFSAVNPSTSLPLLTVKVSPGLQIGQRSRPITVNGTGHSIIGGGVFPLFDTGTASGISVNASQTLGIVAPEIHLTGGIVETAGGNIHLYSVSEGSLTIRNNRNDWFFDSTAVKHFGNIQLSSQALVQSSGLLSGNIHLQAQNIGISDGSLIMAQQSGAEPGGDILINAIDSLQISGDARIAPPQTTIFGTIPGVVASTITNDAFGIAPAGDIVVTGGRVQLIDGGQFTTRSYGSGNTGNINIDVAEILELRGTAPSEPSLLGGIASVTAQTGNAGSIQIKSQNLSILDGAVLLSSTVGPGRGGNVNVQVAEDLIIEGFEPVGGTPSSLNSTTAGAGDSGTVLINTARLAALNGGSISVSTGSDGNAGSLMVNASESIHISGSIPDKATSNISSSAIISEEVRQALGITGQPSGNAGNVQLNTPQLRVTNRGNVSVGNDGLGDGGRLDINADELVLDRNGAITALSTSGQGGDIVLQLDSFLFLNHRSRITTEARGSIADASSNVMDQVAPSRRPVSRLVNPGQVNVDGGNMSIEAPFILGFNNSDITANALEGTGGNISISTQGLFGLEFRDRLTSNNDITASSEFGLDGTVEISTPDVDPNSQILELSETLVDISQLIRPGCSLDQDQFVLAGRGGLPDSPLELMNGDRTWPDTRDLSAFLSHPSDNLASTPVEQLTIGEPIQEATGMAIAPNGTIQLITSHFYNAARPHASCTS